MSKAAEEKLPDEVVIEAGRGEADYWREVWAFRGLLFYLAWRDIAVRYRQTVLGVAWALIQPFLAIVVFTIVFNRFAGFQTEEPYALVVFCGQLVWQFFASSLGYISASFVANQNLITKVYFPRIIMPCSGISVAFVDFGVAFLFLTVLMAWFQFVPPWTIVFVPIFIAMTALASISVGLIIATLNVTYRDFRYIIPMILQFGIFLSPVGYLSSKVSEEWRLIFSINPLVGAIDGMRWAILGGNHTLYWPGLVMSLMVTIFLTLMGIKIFRRMERTFADVI